MRLITKIMAGIALFIILLVTTMTVQWLAFVRKPLPVPPAGASVVYYPGESLNAFSEHLKQEGLIKRSWFFVVLSRMQGVDRHLHAGEYRITPGMTPQMFLDKLVKGDAIQHVFRVGEGWTVGQVLEVMNRSTDFAHSATGLTEESVRTSLDVKQESLEGWLYPDTYFSPIGTNELNVLRRAYHKMVEVVQEEWNQRANDLPYTTPEEALVMASIIEKETGVPDERGKVAGVFVRRLQKGMPLQADPTVIYGLGKKYQGKLTKEDLTTPTPYNTYTQTGLPPTPIAIPSRAAIHAALHPESGNALYFVAKGDGTHEFSATLIDHNAAVRQYQLQNNTKPKEIAPAPVVQPAVAAEPKKKQPKAAPVVGKPKVALP